MAHEPTNPWDSERVPRNAETREREQRPPAWQPASQLPEPDPRPGWTHRWVRVSTLNQEDTTHFSQMRREGWEPCEAQEYPELALDLARNDSHYSSKGMIEVGGLILCRLPDEGAQMRREYYAEKSSERSKSATNELLTHQHNATKMGTFVERDAHSVSFGQGATEG